MTERCVSLEFILYHRSLDPSIKNHKTTSFQILYTRQRSRWGWVGYCAGSQMIMQSGKIILCQKGAYNSKINVFTKEALTSANLSVCEKRHTDICTTI